MQTEKPIKLIKLLNDLKNETVKTNYKSIYIDIAKEVKSIEFQHNVKEPFQGIVYKRLVQLTIKEFVYLGQTDESISNLEWLIKFLDTTSILSR